ncbi:regulatory protein RecX, partial [Propionibacterium acidifaciens F0233]
MVGGGPGRSRGRPGEAGSPGPDPAAPGPGDAPAPGSPDPDADPAEVVRELALRRLEQRDYSRGELVDHLVRRRGCERGVVDAVLDRFEAVGLVDDARFAALWAESRRRSRGLSGGAIARELRARHVSEEIIAGVLASFDPDGEAATAQELARSRARTMRGLDRRVAYRRLAGFLARRGYGPSVAADAVARALDELPEDSEPS